MRKFVVVAIEDEIKLSALICRLSLPATLLRFGFEGGGTEVWPPWLPSLFHNVSKDAMTRTKST